MFVTVTGVLSSVLLHYIYLLLYFTLIVKIETAETRLLHKFPRHIPLKPWRANPGLQTEWISLRHLAPSPKPGMPQSTPANPPSIDLFRQKIIFPHF